MLGKIVRVIDKYTNKVAFGKAVAVEKLNELESRVIVIDIRDIIFEAVTSNSLIDVFDSCSLQILPSRIRVSAVRNHTLLIKEINPKLLEGLSVYDVIDIAILHLE